MKPDSAFKSSAVRAVDHARAGPGRRVASLVLIALVFLGIGYQSGRVHIVGQLRDRFFEIVKKPDPELPLGPPERADDTRTYRQLVALFDRERRARAQKASPWLELLDTSSLPERQRIKDELQDELHRLLPAWPGHEADLEPQRTFWFSQDGIDVWLVRLQTHPEVSLLSALLVPDDLDQPTPALLLLHGAGGNLQKVVSDLDYHHGFGMELAQDGFIVLAPLRASSTFSALSVLHVWSQASGRSLEAVEVWQLVRAVDYLAALDEVDIDHLGVYGVSQGGQRALMLGALDDRLSLVLVSGYFTDRSTKLFELSPAGSLEQILMTPPSPFLWDDLNLVALIEPRFFGVMSGEQEALHDLTAAEFKQVSRLYDHSGHPERADFLVFEGGHEVSVDTIMPFLDKWVQTTRIARE